MPPPTPTDQLLVDSTASRPAPRTQERRWIPACWVLAAVACAIVLTRTSGWLPAAGAGALLAGAAMIPWRRTRGSAVIAAPTIMAADGSDPAALARQVVPVWARQLDGTRKLAADKADELVERFAKVSGHLDVALAATAAAPDLAPGGLDALIDGHRAELDQLVAASNAALVARDEAAASLEIALARIEGIVALTGELQGIGRATQMLSLNASVEATRAGAAGTRFAVVAHEVRALATQSRQVAARMSRQVAEAREQVVAARDRARRDATGVGGEGQAEGLRGEIERRARALVRALLGSLAETARSSRTLREAGKQAQADIDQILMNLQVHDRLNQMLSAVTGDMGRLRAWLEGTPDEAAANAVAWLERLESTYPMQDMQSLHHGAASIDKQAAVEFF